jgi:hypothetical protein
VFDLDERVKWFRDRADLHQKREEKEKLKTAFGLTIKHHTKMSEHWSELSKRMLLDRPGAATYTARHSEMYMELAEDCFKVCEKARCRTTELGFSFDSQVSMNFMR